MSGATVDAALAAVPTTVGDAAAPAPDQVENPLPIVKAPIVALEDWPASDDFLLREAVEAGGSRCGICNGAEWRTLCAGELRGQGGGRCFTTKRFHSPRRDGWRSTR